MLPSSLLQKRSLPAILTFVVVGSALVFLLPYFVPMAPSISDSYAFGFNNRVALVLFLAFAAVFAYWSGGLGLIAREPENEPVPPPMSRAILWGTLGITAAVTLGFWSVYRTVGAINEGAYLMDRLQHLAAGERIYRGFEFIYGPTMLYLPLALHRAGGLSLLDAYYLAWVLAWVGGVALLWITVSWACASSPHKNGIYLLAFLGFFFATASLGLNYTPLRFAGAPFFAVLTARMLQRRGSVFVPVATALAGGAWVLFYSPEQGIAFLLATPVYFVLFGERERPSFRKGLAVLVFGEALLGAALAQTGVVPYMRGMASGGYNLPLLPSLYVLVLLGLLLAAGCVLVNTLRLRQRGGALAYLVLVSLFALPAAFGRCDPGHIFMNTLGAFLAAWTVISYRRGAGRWMVWSYAASALFLPLALYQENNFFMFPVKAALFSPADPHPGLRLWMVRSLDRAVGPGRAGVMLAKWRAAYPVVQPSDVPGKYLLLAPLGYPSTLLLTGLPPITNGRYRGLGNVMTSSEVGEKIEEMRTHPGDLLLFTAASQCPRTMPDGPPSVNVAAEQAAMDRATRRELWLNLQPLFLPHVRHAEGLLNPVCAYVAGHYRLTGYRGPLAGSTVWERDPNR